MKRPRLREVAATAVGAVALGLVVLALLGTAGAIVFGQLNMADITGRLGPVGDWFDAQGRERAIRAHDREPMAQGWQSVDCEGLKSVRSREVHDALVEMGRFVEVEVREADMVTTQSASPERMVVVTQKDADFRGVARTRRAFTLARPLVVHEVAMGPEGQARVVLIDPSTSWTDEPLLVRSPPGVCPPELAQLARR